jgi:predicted TIM-barrel fold metal-dependent hydrolase
MIIDAHIHISAAEWIPPKLQLFYARRAAYGSWPYRDPLDLLPRVGQGQSDPDGSYTIAQMDAHGIDIAIPMPMDKATEMGEEAQVTYPEIVEAHAAIMQAHPGRLYGFLGVDPRRKGGVELFRKAVREYGFKGLKFYPGAGFFPYDEICYPYYRAAMELGVPVAFHTSPTYAPSSSRFSHPMHISDLHRDFPELPVIYAHAGRGPWWVDAAELAKCHPLGFLELSGWAGEARQDPGEFIRKLAKMRDIVGTHRIVWGSDFSFGKQNAGDRSPLPAWLHAIEQLPTTAAEHGFTFGQDEVDLILGGNMQRLLGL